MAAIFRRELGLLFGGWRAWTYLALTLALGGALCFTQNLSGANPAYQQAVPLVAIGYLLTVPLLAMDACPGDRRRGTDRLLAALPLRPIAVAAGKYWALAMPVAIGSAALMAFPAAMTPYGQVPMAAAAGAIAMHLLLGAMLTAAALFMSALSRGQWTGFFTAALLLCAMYFAPQAAAWLAAARTLTAPALVVVALAALALGWLVCRNGAAALAVALIVELGVIASRLASREDLAIGALRAAARALAAFDRLTAVQYGLFDGAAAWYYLTATALLLGLSGLALARRVGWKGAKA
ncbi:MAG: hypothetical protein GX558_10270 [Clostridiales bacterium]|nr:hypothetical protein [Clostridiales bacterium]